MVQLNTLILWTLSSLRTARRVTCTRWIRNVLILGICGAFALNALLIMHVFVPPVPSNDAWDSVPFIATYVDGGMFWEDPSFHQHQEHRIYIHNLILLLDVYLFSWSDSFQMYLGWIMLVASAVLVHIMIKRYDPRLVWLMIPICALMFNPKQIGMFLWPHSMSMWTPLMLGSLACIYFLDKSIHSKIWLVPAIVSAIAVTFTAAPGMIIWVAGLFSLFNPRFGRIPSIVYVTAAAATIATYFIGYEWYVSPAGSLISDPMGIPSKLLDPAAMSWMLGFISNGITLPDHLMPIFGVIILIAVMALPAYCIYAKKLAYSRIVPFVQMSACGIFLSVLTYIGRNERNFEGFNYVLRGNFVEFAFLIMSVIVLLIFVQSRLAQSKKPATEQDLIGANVGMSGAKDRAEKANSIPGKKRKITYIVIYVVVMGVFSYGLTVSFSNDAWHPNAYGYYSKIIFDPQSVQSNEGWHPSAYPRYFKSHSQLQCIHDPNADFCPYVTVPKDYRAMMADRNLGPYRNIGFTSDTDKLLDGDNWQDMQMDDSILLYAHHVGYRARADNGWNHTPDVSTRNMVMIKGWAATNHTDSNTALGPVDVYVFVGDDVIKKAHYGHNSPNIDDIKNITGRILYHPPGWSLLFHVSALEPGCNEVRVRAVPTEAHSYKAFPYLDYQTIASNVSATSYTEVVMKPLCLN